MSEEEKKAIENLEELSHYCSLRAIDIEEENSNLWASFCVSIQRVENLIEKQQAEIEKKDKEINILKDELGYTRKLIERENK